MTAKAYGDASASYPFVNTDEFFGCSVGGSFSAKPLAIECEAFGCKRGEYGTPGISPGCQQCPADRPSSQPISTSVDDCRPPPEDCVELQSFGCRHTSEEVAVSGAWRVMDDDEPCLNVVPTFVPSRTYSPPPPPY